MDDAQSTNRGDNFLHAGIQFAILILSGLIICGNLQGEYEPFDHCLIDILLLVAAWLFALWLTHTHKPKFYQQKAKYILSPFIKSIIIIFSFHWIIINVLYNRVTSLNRSNLIILLYSVLLLCIYSFWIHRRNSRGSNDVGQKGEAINQYLQNDLKMETSFLPGAIGDKLLSKSQLFSPDIVSRLLPINNNNNLNEVVQLVSDIDMLDKSQQSELIISDSRLDDEADINSYIATIYHALVAGGCALFAYQDIEDFKMKILSGATFYSKMQFYIYFAVHSLLLQTPFLNKIYRAVSKRKNKVLSRVEVLGRLYYSGFAVKSEVKVDGLSYICVRKEKEPSSNPNPSFYPIICLNRVGLYGRIIKIHKIRTMYPYSEFLQKKVFDDNNLTSIGKFGDDFRITRFGKFYRKYWLDELPQIIDWLRGEIKLVGIRAMSQHYFSLYPSDYQKCYLQVKPGILSPIFDENTQGFSDIARIEKQYLESYLRRPIVTDIKYFIMTFKNILQGTRSK